MQKERKDKRMEYESSNLGSSLAGGDPVTGNRPGQFIGGRAGNQGKKYSRQNWAHCNEY